MHHVSFEKGEIIKRVSTTFLSAAKKNYLFLFLMMSILGHMHYKNSESQLSNGVEKRITLFTGSSC